MEMSPMIDKRFVVIVLATGLIASVGIGIILGQEDKDKLIQEMKEKELAIKDQAALFIPSAEQPMDQLGKNSLVSKLDELPPGIESTALPQNEPINRFEIDSYDMGILARGPPYNPWVQEYITCYNEGRTAEAYLGFYDDNDVKGALDYPQNRLETRGGNSTIYLFYPHSRYSEILDILEGDGTAEVLFMPGMPPNSRIAFSRNR
jgi:hypothetical protein